MPTPSTRTTRRTVQDKPAKARMNLDTLQREGAPVEPYGFFAGGRHFELTDPRDVDWQDLVKLEADPIGFFARIMSKGDAAAFLAVKQPAWKIEKLMADYKDYFGMVDPGEDQGSSIS